METRTCFIPLSLVCVLFSACLDPAPPGVAPPPAFTAQGQRQSLELLAKWSGTPWRVRYEAEHHTAAFLQGHSPTLGTPAAIETAARQFLLSYRALFGVTRDDELVHEHTQVDDLGMRHIRFIQRLGKVPVFGSALTVHVDPTGAVCRVHGRTVPLSTFIGSGPTDGTPPISMSISMSIPSETARQTALDLVQRTAPQASLTALTPVLYYLSLHSDLRLVFRVEVEGQDPQVPLRRALFLDAATGDLVQEDERLAFLGVPQPAMGSGVGVLGDRKPLDIIQQDATFSLQDLVRGKAITHAMTPGGRLPGKIIKSADPESWDVPGQGAAVDVHAHLATIWDYFAREHQRFGWAGDGKGSSASVHFGDRQAIALFDGRHLIFGDGDGGDYLAMGAALDVVAHEYTHAILRSAVDLAGHGESAALEEGLADLFACFVEQTAQPDRGNWTIGELVYRPGGVMTPMRNLEDPRKTDQAMTWAQYQGQKAGGKPEEQQRVVVNAGIIGHAGYTLAQRAGIPASAAIFYRAMTVYLHQTAGFFDGADAVLAAALDLHGPDSAVIDQVRATFAEAGVGTIETVGESAGSQ